MNDAGFDIGEQIHHFVHYVVRHRRPAAQPAKEIERGNVEVFAQQDLAAQCLGGLAQGVSLKGAGHVLILAKCKKA